MCKHHKRMRHQEKVTTFLTFFAVNLYHTILRRN